MEAIEEFLATHPHHDDHRDHHSLVVKGKRTKRLRPPSPPQGLAAAVTSSSSTACEYNSAVSPSSSSGNNNPMYESTEEEEDMANCLILLAQGDAPRRIEEEESELRARKLSEAPAVAVSPAVSVSAVARGGVVDVYECKTCNRVFPSFQALGGHRASHKKPKTGGDEQKKPPIAADFAVYRCEDDRFVKRSMSPPLSLSLANNNKSLAASAPSPFQAQINTRPKIHGCSICGSEFTSGQALGGHMRRHRAHPPATATRDSIVSDDSSPIDEKPRNNILELDLNLPAPEEDKFQFAAPQPPIVVFSAPALVAAPALVDCHY